jgi:hypothetical protein
MVMNLTVNLQRAIQMHMMKVINVDMMMGGLEKNIIVLILRLQQVLVRQQAAVMMMSINIDTEIAQRQVQAQQLLLAAGIAQQQVQVPVLQRAVDQQQLSFYCILLHQNLERQIFGHPWNTVYSILSIPFHSKFYLTAI